MCSCGLPTPRQRPTCHPCFPPTLFLQAQCSWHEGDTGGALKRQLEALLAALEAEAGQAGGSGAASSAGGAAGAAAAPSAFFPAVPAGTPAAGQSQEQRRRRELGELVGLPSAADVRQLLSSLETADKMRLAGNAAIKAGKAAEAVQKYTEALAGGQVWGSWGVPCMPALRQGACLALHVPEQSHCSRAHSPSCLPSNASLTSRSRRPIPCHCVGAALQPCRRAPTPQAACTGERGMPQGSDAGVGSGCWCSTSLVHNARARRTHTVG